MCWHAIQNDDPHIIKVILLSLYFSFLFISMQRGILTFTSLNDFSSLVRGWKNRGVERAFRWKLKIHLECALMGRKEVGLRLTRHPFQSLRKFGAKSEFLTHQATLSCYPCVQKSNTEFTLLLKQHYKFPEKTNWENIIISLTSNHNLIKDFLESLTWLLTGTEPFPRSRTISTSIYMANLLTRMITTWQCLPTYLKQHAINAKGLKVSKTLYMT